MRNGRAKRFHEEQRQRNALRLYYAHLQLHTLPFAMRERHAKRVCHYVTKCHGKRVRKRHADPLYFDDPFIADVG